MVHELPADLSDGRVRRVEGRKGGRGSRPLSVFHRCERTGPLNLTDKGFTAASSLNNEVGKFKRIREFLQPTLCPRAVVKLIVSLGQYAIGKFRKKKSEIQKHSTCGLNLL